MAYRFYCFDGANKIIAVEVLEAANDQEAIRIARSLNKPLKCELWLDGRLVAVLPRGQ